LGISSVNMFSLSILYGLNMGIDTIVNRHYGRRDFLNCGFFLYKSIIFGFM